MFQNKFSNLVCIAASCLSLAVVAGCRPSSSGNSESEVETVFFGKSLLRSKNVNVCWEFTSAETASFRSEFQNTVNKAFAKTKLRFSGWGKCPGSGSDFRIFIYDDSGSSADREFLSMKAMVNQTGKAYTGHPRVNLVGNLNGNWILGKKAGIILNRSGLDSLPVYVNMLKNLSPNGRKNLGISGSLHEFGHAIGMRHEDAHSNNKCEEFDEQLYPGDVQIGPWNPTSFMERCFYRNFDYEKGIVWPNDLDIAGINKRYP